MHHTNVTIRSLFCRDETTVCATCLSTVRHKRARYSVRSGARVYTCPILALAPPLTLALCVLTKEKKQLNKLDQTQDRDNDECLPGISDKLFDAIRCLHTGCTNAQRYMRYVCLCMRQTSWQNK